MPKICLFALNSSYSHTNAAVRCIRHSLRAAGFETEILEYNLKDKRRTVLEALYGADAELYGFSAYIWNIRELLAFASDLKRLRPGARILFGGPEVSYDAAEILADNPAIDGIITGEGETAWVEIARKFDAGETLPRIYEGGIFAGFASQPAVYEENHAGMRMVYYESARGCPFRCAYCLSALSGTVRAKSAEQTLAELRQFEGMEGIRVVKFVDRTFNFDRERAKIIWRGLLSPEYTRSYHFEICADLLDEEAFAILAKFPRGKVQLEIGVQSTNPDTLRRISRNPKTDTLLANLARLYRMGNMHIHADLIAGLPGEDYKSFARSFDALWGHCHMLQLGFLKLLRGSVLRKQAHTFGCIFSEQPPYEVLATDCLTFSELSRLHEIDGLMDRYVNSGAFVRTFTLLERRHASPFAMMETLAAGFRASKLRLDAISQPKAYEMLYEVFGIREDKPLAQAILLDFLTHQKLNPPKIGGMELSRAGEDARRRFLHFAGAAGTECFPPALEARCLLDGGICIIDRKLGRAFRQTDDGFAEI